ncbi:outer membrane receptor protein involved in Fe transport [Gelidibacter sediminis]|uniref:Outer membrane receptor protein involved in Fe transport n=1 Tax=Gelidibacter sediminis TaxID=1608710 RepID=A0A4R7Q874_9FLAO|nr:carboxypeptidase-like regulatory domain-containing protein [Gelidibacter sediminis]TDU43744.1 outer membrane receptor protein involved in Fe transport [Gelidibacter sediminis]
MKKLTQFLMMSVAMLFATAAFSQSTVRGKIMDADMNAPLPGANVVEKGTTNGTTTNFDGEFVLTTQSNSGSLVISYVGFGSKTITFSGSQDVGTINLLTDNSLDEVVIVGSGLIDLADDRKTPIAVSTIRASEIQAKVGTNDVTATLVNTPSVYVAGQASGFGDSRISVRGFEQDNTAFLLNGQPINGMEDGKMYWSNWSGMSDIASAIQIQRGLGSSKLAISSVGGTVNFVTKATDKREGGFIQAGVANNNYVKTTVGYSSGMTETGWGVSAMLTHWQGDGYNNGTFGEGQNYFVSVGYKANDNHNFNFLITGAPQQHDQNFSKSIETYLERGRKFNDNYGFYNGEYLTERTNYYHKPVANLNWDWDINDNSRLSSVLYASWGRGGGTGNYGRSSGRVRDAETGLIDFDAIAANNATKGEGSFGNSAYLLRASANNHNWYGFVSNFETELSENLTLNAGLDLRTYYGTHYRQVVNFIGLDSWKEDVNLRGADHQRNSANNVIRIIDQSNSINPWNATFNTAAEDQRINYDYSERINYGGAFTQVEYATDAFSAFFQGSVSSQNHERYDRYDYVAQYKDAEKVNNVGYNLKTGGSFLLNEDNSIYVNAGYYSRQPYHDNIYLNFTNQVNPLTQNEKILGLEAGYAFKSAYFTANLNAYRTSWKDRVTSSSRVLSRDTEIGGTTIPSGTQVFTTNEGVEQLHQGLELDFVAKPTSKLDIKGFASFGNWEYVGDAVTTTRDDNRVVLDIEAEDVDGGKVGDAAQFTVGLGLDYEILERFSIDADYRMYDKLYSNVGAVKDNVELPSYDIMDAGISYKMLLGKEKTNSLNLRLNVNNVFGEVYLSELRTAYAAEAGDDTYKGINVRNQGYFGYLRTWNFSLRYNF